MWFLIGPDEDAPSLEVDAEDRWSLPGVSCSACRATWATIGLEYPTVDLSGWVHETEYRKARAEPLDEFVRLRMQVAPAVPDYVSLRPGTCFGSLEGRVTGSQCTAFIWQSPWRPLITLAAAEQLGLVGQAPGRLVASRLVGAAAFGLHELEIAVAGELTLPAGTTTCSACGRLGVSWPPEPVLVAASLPANTPLFRLANFTTKIIGSAAFVDAVLANDLGGLTVTPIEAC